MNITYTPADATGHTATPVTGTYTVEDGGAPARLLYPEDYPVLAECKICHGTIRLDFMMQMEWRHVPVAQAAPAPPAGDMAS